MRILWPEPVATEIIAAFQRTLETGEAYRSRDFSSPRADTDNVESYEWELHRITLPDGQAWVSFRYYFDSTRLRRAEQALREADRRKDEFLATLAHELRNPLAPIRNGLQILRSTEFDPAAAPQVHEMLERQVEPPRPARRRSHGGRARDARPHRAAQGARRPRRDAARAPSRRAAR